MRLNIFNIFLHAINSCKLYYSRQDLLKQCQKSKCDKILITHGTDTMIETAAYLASKLLDTNQMTTRTIILTGKWECMDT